MSLLTPPTRRTRGLVIPGLDTKFSVEDMATSIAYGGLHTPPQSAHESRRPSTQSSWTDTPYSAVGSGYACSLPSTPIHKVHHSHDDYIHGWSDPDTASSGSVNRNLDNHVVDSNFSGQAYHPVTGHGLPSYPNAVLDTGSNTFGLPFGAALPSHETMAPPVQTMCTFVAQAPCLGADLFPISHDMSSENACSGPSHHNSASSLRALSANLDINTVRPIDNHAASQAPFYHHPQVIVPSQLSPQDVYDHSQVDGYTGLGGGDEMLANSFASSATLDSFELMDPPSPMEMYFERSEDESYVPVKLERPYHSRSVSPKAAKSKRRGCKRSRGARRPWHRHETGGIEVECQGKQFPLDRPVKHSPGAADNMHQCTFMLNGKMCTHKFARSEHLKRHALSHTDHRPYPCPLDGCKTKAIQRTDNACDHFKTHLRPSKKGKRNFHVEVHEFHRALWEIYDERTAQKVWVKIDKWIKAGMPDPSGRQEREAHQAHAIENGFFTPVSPGP